MLNRMVLLIIVLCSNIARAGINEDLKNYFNALGVSHNISHAKHYQGQQAGYYSGGSFYARPGVRNVELIKINFPNISAGCGGIDLFTGGFSYINQEEFINVGKNILNNATGYAFKLALSTFSPLFSSTLEKLHTTANAINQHNINACETARNLVGGVWSKVAGAQKEVCQEIAVASGQVPDWGLARQACGASGRANAILNSATQSKAYREAVLFNKNLAWSLIQKNAFLRSDHELSTLLMNLSGTIIVGDTLEKITLLPSKLEDKTILQALLYGGKVNLYQCVQIDDKENCLHPTLEKITIAEENGFLSRVIKILETLVDKTLSDTPLNNDEINFLNLTSLPVYKMISVQTAYGKQKSIVDITSFSELIASDILFQYLSENLNVLEHSINGLQFNSEIVSTFRKGIQTAIQKLHALQSKPHVFWASQKLFIEQAKQQERALSSELAGSIMPTIS